eukprot:PhM_4_TR16364/c0_g1_i1/m.33499/K12625/LSM6; U6 snRNA-associated Sm-like protein LSm6
MATAENNNNNNSKNNDNPIHRKLIGNNVSVRTLSTSNVTQSSSSSPSLLASGIMYNGILRAVDGSLNVVLENVTEQIISGSGDASTAATAAVRMTLENQKHKMIFLRGNSILYIAPASAPAAAT